eukprot:gb/GECG01007403.1/.p1 GENE.gb/GECG01007403.1/~~gb/GECG01007403.1/.p1  ORF type:complete len:733 (+),score=73.31 gb/GECG01007403.1/:1-2199(+)
MLEAAGRDGKRLIQSRSEFMRRYIQYRYGLLHQTLLRGFQEDSKGEEQGPRQFDAARLKRFGFDQDRNLQAFFRHPPSDDASPKEERTDAQEQQQPARRVVNSYHAWRKMLLWQKFYSFRGEVEETILRRMAADAMNRAMVAEREERERYYQMSDSDSDMESTSSEEDEEASARRRNLRKHAETRWTVPIGMTEWAIISTILSDKQSLQLVMSSRRNAEKSRVQSTHVSSGGFGTAIKFANGFTSNSGRKNNDQALRPDDPGDRIFAFGSHDGCVAVVDALRSAVLCAALGLEGNGHTGSVTCLDWSPENMYLVSSSTDATLRIWTPSFDSVFDSKKRAKVLSTEPLKCIRKVDCNAPVSHCFFLSTNANVVIFTESGSSQSTSSQERTSSLLSSPLARFRGGHSRPPSSIAALNVSTGKIIQRVPANAPVCALSMNHNSSQLFASDDTGRIFSHSIAIDPQSQLSNPIGELKRFIHVSAPLNSPLASRASQSRFSLRQNRHTVLSTLSSPVIRLCYKPYDTSFRCPILVCVDKTGEVFALKLSSTVNAMQSSMAQVGSHPSYSLRETAPARRSRSKPQFQSATRIMAKFEHYLKPRVRSVGMKLSLCSPCRRSDCVAISTFGRDIQIIDPHAKTISMTFVATLLGHSGTVVQQAWNNSETCLVTADQSGQVVIWGQKRSTEALGIETATPELYESVQPEPAASHSVLICPNCQKKMKESQMLTHIEECVSG